MISEIQLHKEVKHRSICQLERAFEDEDHVYMLLELCSNGVSFSSRQNMFDLIKKRKKLTIAETQYFIYQLIDGLCYLHNKQIIHRE
jgi:serine/threonine protein kinase